MENLEKSWNSIFSYSGLEKSWKLTPGFGKFVKVMESKRDLLAKRRCSFLSSSISIQGYFYVIRSNFGVFHIFLYCDSNLVVLKGKTGWSSWPWCMSLSCQKAYKRSWILKLWSWRNHGKVMEKILKFSGYTLYCPYCV